MSDTLAAVAASCGAFCRGVRETETGREFNLGGNDTEIE